MVYRTVENENRDDPVSFKVKYIRSHMNEKLNSILAKKLNESVQFVRLVKDVHKHDYYHGESHRDDLDY